MDIDSMADFVIERLTKMKCPPLVKVESITKFKLEKAYKILVENENITLERYLNEMGLENE